MDRGPFWIIRFYSYFEGPKRANRPRFFVIWGRDLASFSLYSECWTSFFREYSLLAMLLFEA
jgi:hypothetical protein